MPTKEGQMTYLVEKQVQKTKRSKVLKGADTTLFTLTIVLGDVRHQSAFHGKSANVLLLQNFEDIFGCWFAGL